MKKTFLLHKTRTLFKAPLAVAAIICLGLLQQADAGVVWLASDDGANLTLTATGSLAVSGLVDTTTTAATTGQINATTVNFFGITGTFRQDFGVGVHTGNDPWIAGDASTASLTGDTFGHFGPDLIWAPAEAPVGGPPATTLTPITTMTFSGLTVASAFGSNLNAGPVVLWTFTATGDTISVDLATVPEPSSCVTLAIGLASILLRRRRYC